MKRLLERRDAWGNTAAVWVLAAAAFLTPLIGYGLSFVRLENNVEDWLPENDPLARTFAWYKGHFPSEQKVLVSWRGARLDDPRIERLARRLEGTLDNVGVRRGGSPYVAEVSTPEDGVAAIARRGVTREEALRRLTGLLVGPRRGASDDSRPAALIATLSEAGDADHGAAVADLAAAAEAVGIPSAGLALGGSAVTSSSLNNSLRRTAWDRDAPASAPHRRSAILLSAVVALGLAFVLLRSVRVTTLVLGVTMFVTLGCVALVPATGGGMNMVLVIMPTLMMVLTLSSSMHVVCYRNRAAHAGERDPAAAAVRTAWGATILAQTTTGIGLLSLVTSPLAPVRDFGLYSAVGCFLMLPVVLWVLPAVMQLLPFPVGSEASAGRAVWRRLAGVLVRRRRLVTVTGLVLLAVGTGGLYWFRTETKVIRYLPQNSDVVRDYEFLERELAGVVPVETVVIFDRAARQRLSFTQRAEQVRAVTEKLRRHSEVSGALSLADFLPVTERPAADASFARKAKYNRQSALAEERAKELGSDAAAFLAICKSAPDSSAAVGGRPVAVGDELWRITAHASLMSNVELPTLLGELDSALRAELAAEQGTSYVVTGAVPLFVRTQQALLESLIYSFVSGFVMICGVLMWMLRSVRAGLIAMLPNVLPVALIFGAVSAAGVPFDIGTMITASIAIGVAVDGTLHFCELFREEVARGVSKRKAVADSMAACGPALWQTVLVVSGGWLMLAGADLLLVSRFGWLMAVLVAAALLGDVFLLPALLGGTLGRLLVPKRTPPAPAVESTGPGTPVPAPHAWQAGPLVTAYRAAYHSEHAHETTPLSRDR